MNYLLYTIIILLILVWAVGVLFFNAGSAIHLLLLIALISVVGTVLYGSSHSDDNMKTL